MSPTTDPWTDREEPSAEGPNNVAATGGRGAPGPQKQKLRELTSLLRGRSVVALTGAGCSTESGIPDYRGPDGRRETGRPMLYGEFVGDVEARARYWARSSVGWRRVARARPNGAHRALARLERRGPVAGVITQNVDGLHGAAGSRRVVELHGSLDRVCCLECGAAESRRSVQRRLAGLNPGWWDRNGGPRREAGSRPDGDAEIADDVAAEFRVPGCRRCGGVLKPDVVFFGENVPPARVEEAWTLFRRAEVLLVVGSSLSVYSGYRFVRRAAERDLPVAILNVGPTRGDDVARVRVDGRAGQLLPRVATALTGPPREGPDPPA